MLVLIVGSFSIFGEISQMTVNYQSDLAFWGFPSFLFSLYLLSIYQGLSAGAPPPGPTAAAAVALTVRAAPPPPSPPAAAVGGGPQGSGGPRPLGGRPTLLAIAIGCI